MLDLASAMCGQPRVTLVSASVPDITFIYLAVYLASSAASMHIKCGEVFRGRNNDS